MWTTKITRKTSATKEKIWKLWADVPNWSTWDKDVEKAELFGDFAVGTKGILRPVGGPKVKFEIIECEKFKSFTSRSSLPLCTVDFIHSMNEIRDGLEITYEVQMTGILTFLFSRVIGKKMAIELPTAVDKLIELTEINTNGRRTG